MAAGRCAWQRRKTSYCDERTELQLAYAESVTNGSIEDPMAYLFERMDRRGAQAYCTVNNGFLAFGRPVVPTERNRLLVRNEHRCLNYGTDRMVGMLEWVGRRIARQYSAPESQAVKLIVGDISAPRGGCLAGRPGRRGHASHTSGQDVDFAFLNPKNPHIFNGNFYRVFDPEANWWLIKQVFRNPFACVRVAFLDRTLIRKLSKVARGDPEWAQLSPFIRHSRGHANHFHVRVGTNAGGPGCLTSLNSEDFLLEDLEESGDPETDDDAGSDVEPASTEPSSGAPSAAVRSPRQRT
ncbi:MAG: hypothetical protein A2X94_03320 [Bdellovibrionales bacterium GWB1_55_8]|nr:MAG: hypothetical protein A2X94_03320 [Bdellovibrionales bacterium GWB1_55_8]